MNWQQMIDQFQQLEQHQVPSFAKTREMEQALHLYNKSVEHISHDSSDIALIALRRLASDYPRFGMASFLAGCLLAQDEAYEEALALTTQAVEQGQLEAQWLGEAENCIETLQQELHLASEAEKTEGHKSHSGKAAINTSAILEKIKRKKKVKMASDRERQELLRQGDQVEEETFVESPRQLSDYLRLAAPVLGGVILVVLLIFAGVRLVSSARADRDTDADQLEWLLSRLELMASDDEEINALLAEYGHLFDQPGITETDDQDSTETSLPETEPTTDAPDETTHTEPDPDETDAPDTTTTLQPTETEPPVDPLPTPEPTTDPDILLVDQAVNALQQARNLQSEDLMSAADQLFMARTILEAVPAATQPENQELNAGELLSEVNDLMDEIARPAANEFRVAGRALFDSEAYEDALVLYLKAFELDPGNYGGGTAYYTGRCYQMLGQYEAARPYYEYVVDTFSGRDIAGYSANRLREMGY